MDGMYAYLILIRKDADYLQVSSNWFIKRSYIEETTLALLHSPMEYLVYEEMS